MNYKRFITEVALFAFLIFCLLPNDYCKIDVEGFFQKWTIFIYHHSIGEAYNSGSNYPPLYLYLLKIFAWIQGSDEEIKANIKYIKTIPLVFDIFPVFLLLIGRKIYALKKNYHYLLLFNIAYLYNTVIWGQVDSIHTALAFSGIFLSVQVPMAAALFYIMALNMKIQAIIFFPVILLGLILKVDSLKKWIMIIVSSLLLQFLILCPFIFAGNLDQYWFVVINSIGRITTLSINAYNFWYLILTENPYRIDGQDIFFIFTYRTWGLILFFMISAIVLIPLLIKTILSIRLKRIMIRYREMLFLTGGIIALVFFFFNAEMHERYSHPAILFFFFYGVYSRNFLLYILASVAYFLNMEDLMKFFDIAHHTLIFDPHFIASLFLITMTSGTFLLYKKYRVKEDLQKLLRY